MRRLPIRVRVTLGFAGAMAVLLGGLGLFIYVRYASQLDEAIDQGLRSRADEVAAVVQRPGSLLEGSGNERLVEQDEGFTQIVAGSGRVLDSTTQLGGESVLEPDQVAEARGGPTIFDAPPPPGIEGEVRVLATPIERDDRTLVVVAGTSLDDREEAMSSLAALMLAGGPVALLLASLAGYAAAGAALRPVEAMRRRAAGISAAEPERRLPVPASRDEVSRLGETLNEMLARLETALERERTFVDDASHELRTPLALLKTELELALRYETGEGELRAAVVSAREEVDRLIQLAEDLLVVARSVRGRLPIDLQPVEVGTLLADVGKRFVARAAETGRELHVESPEKPLTVEGDRLRLEQALTNLVDNALRHGGGAVTLSARAAAGSTVELHVGDDGEGFPVEFLPHAFERFSRADPGRTGGGSGFGLAIVAAIADAHQGKAGAANDPMGGTDVWLTVPASAKDLDEQHPGTTERLPSA